MHITISSNQTFTALVPKSEYKGPILKLTAKDKEKISKLVSQKSELLFEINFLEKMLNKKKTLVESSNLLNRIGTLEFRIKEIDETIKSIKTTRLEKQQGKLKKIDLMV